MRLFFSLVPPPSIIGQLLLCQAGIANARWQSADNLHLTLRYIGTIDTDRAEMLMSAVKQQIWTAPKISLNGVGYFDRKGMIDQIWAGVTGKEALTRLHKQLDHIAINCGLPPESRKYIPHITLARLSKKSRGAARYVAEHSNLASAAFICDRLVLFESHIGYSGASYHELASWPMSTPAQ